MLIRKTPALDLRDEAKQFGKSYAKKFSGTKMVIQIHQAIDEQDLATFAHDLARVDSKIDAEIHLVVGEFPFEGSRPNDDWSYSDQRGWSHRRIHHAAARISEALAKAGLEALYTHPVVRRDDSNNVVAIASKFKSVFGRSSIFIWSPMFLIENEIVEDVDPVGFSVDLATAIDATKIVCIQPPGGNLQIGDKTVSWIRTDEVEQLISDKKVVSSRGNCPEAQQLMYQNKRALIALRDFVASKPEIRRGHLLGLARRALSSELLTVSGYGTMISDHALKAIPGEVCYQI